MFLFEELFLLFPASSSFEGESWNKRNFNGTISHSLLLTKTIYLNNYERATQIISCTFTRCNNIQLLFSVSLFLSHYSFVSLRACEPFEERKETAKTNILMHRKKAFSYIFLPVSGIPATECRITSIQFKFHWTLVSEWKHSFSLAGYISFIFIHFEVWCIAYTPRMGNIINFSFSLFY